MNVFFFFFLFLINKEIFSDWRLRGAENYVFIKRLTERGHLWGPRHGEKKSHCHDNSIPLHIKKKERKTGGLFRHPLTCCTGVPKLLSSRSAQNTVRLTKQRRHAWLVVIKAQWYSRSQKYEIFRQRGPVNGSRSQRWFGLNPHCVVVVLFGGNLWVMENTNCLDVICEFRAETASGRWRHALTPEQWQRKAWSSAREVPHGKFPSENGKFER